MKHTVIGWIRGIENWAFRNLTDKLIRALPQFRHQENDPAAADVVFLVTPPQLKTVRPLDNAILHLDSIRALGLE